MHVALDNAGHFTSEHIFENLKDPFEFTFLSLEFGSSIFDLILYLFYFNFFLFLYLYPLGTVFTSIENFFSL
jgi:hypothetical protein